MADNKKVPKREISLVFEDKKGLHEFLTVDMEYFLPGLMYVNIEWLRSIWQGKKKVTIIFSLNC